MTMPTDTPTPADVAELTTEDRLWQAVQAAFGYCMRGAGVTERDAALFKDSCRAILAPEREAAAKAQARIAELEADRIAELEGTVRDLRERNQTQGEIISDLRAAIGDLRADDARLAQRIAELEAWKAERAAADKRIANAERFVATLQARIADLQADNARLTAIVERLPKTADGVPITPGMELWHWDENPTGQRFLECKPALGPCCPWLCFSTPQAAHKRTGLRGKDLCDFVALERKAKSTPPEQKGEG